MARKDWDRVAAGIGGALVLVDDIVAVDAALGQRSAILRSAQEMGRWDAPLLLEHRRVRERAGACPGAQFTSEAARERQRLD